jgi:hypothetical protein
MRIRTLQDHVKVWLEKVLPGQVFDVKTRAARFLEEAAEAAQAAGLEQEDAYRVIEQVYDRPRGIIDHELGSSLTTLCALATAADIDLQIAAYGEINRMETPEIIDKVRRRQAEKVNPR